MNAFAPTRIDIRVDQQKKNLISRAAEILGVNVTQFILERVLPEAEKIVSEERTIRLSKKDWEQFCAKLDEPSKDLPELRRLMRAKSIFVRR
ncbi:MAG: DUF1778 domain-containing protein [Chthoniobacteraceae bacterium]|jgi:uncharacterized protein (DUF1778 family)